MNTKLSQVPSANGFPYVLDEFCAKYGVEKVTDIFPQEKFYPMHWIFDNGIYHIENVGGYIDKVKNKRCTIACIPLRIAAESCPCRLIALIEKG